MSSNLGCSRSQLQMYFGWLYWVTYSPILGDCREFVSLHQSTGIEEHTKCLHVNGSLHRLKLVGTQMPQAHQLAHSGPTSRKYLGLELRRNSTSMNIKCQAVIESSNWPRVLPAYTADIIGGELSQYGRINNQTRQYSSHLFFQSLRRSIPVA